MFSVENLPNTRGDTSLIKNSSANWRKISFKMCFTMINFIFTFQHLSGKVAWAWDCAKCDIYFQSHIGRRNAIGNYKAFVNVECMLKIYINTELDYKQHMHQTLQCMKIIWKVFNLLKTILLVVIVMNINFFNCRLK